MEEMMLKSVARTTTALVLLAAAACGGGSGTEEASGLSGTEEASGLTVYTPIDANNFQYFADAFEEETGTTVEFVSAPTGQTLTRIRAEAENPRASVWFGGSAENFNLANENGLLAPYQSANIEEVPERYRDPEEVWNPIYIGVTAFGFNTEVGEQTDLVAPTDWADLAKPEYARETGIGHPAVSGTAYTFLATLVQLMGEDEAFEYLAGMREAGMAVTESTGASIEAMALGERAIALAFSHDLFQPAVAGQPVEVIFPSSGAGYEIGALALIKDGPSGQTAAAKEFVDWALSKEGQDIWVASGALNLAVNPEAETAEQAPDLNKVKLIDYDFEWAANNRERLLERFDKEISPPPTS